MSNTENTGKQGRRKLVIIASLFFLVIMPIVTVSFSKFGLDRYRAIKREMRLLADSVAMQPFLAISAQGDTFTNESTKGRLLVLHFFENAQSNAAWTEMSRLQKELNDSEDKGKILFLSNQLTADTLTNLPALDSFNAFVLVKTPAEDFLKTSRVSRDKAASTLVLVDVNGLMCDVYDANNPDEINQMLKHISLIMPKTKRRRYEFRADANLYSKENK